MNEENRNIIRLIVSDETPPGLREKRETHDMGAILNMDFESEISAFQGFLEYLPEALQSRFNQMVAEYVVTARVVNEADLRDSVTEKLSRLQMARAAVKTKHTE